MLSSGLTLIFSMMGVLNFAHASFYMLGAYIGYSISQLVGFWAALVVAPLLVGVLGAWFERYCLRRVYKFGHLPELLITFGLSYVILEVVQLVWGRIALDFKPPQSLRGPVFTLVNHSADGLQLFMGAVPQAMCSATDAAVRVVCSPFLAMTRNSDFSCASRTLTICSAVSDDGKFPRGVENRRADCPSPDVVRQANRKSIQ